ncbi:hypothetical protein [Cyanobium sp. CH-040]|uniref:hypothetical protein n=1 Tax=Cyanobium sp. CH-040 TaxID=2823708 RepID=UPI0020CBFCFD|nr:hypothetical protein [Cyanobium sp. CH-040]MCP9926841.1 hypothetical protein [Cyanobium sp. CH-040]
MNRSSSPAASARGLVYSTRGNHPVLGPSWVFWYLRCSKKVWFRLPVPPGAGGPLLFRFDGRPILHRSELAAWHAGRGEHPMPVVWGDRLGVGWGQGPLGTNLYLLIWTRWSWLHPRACGQPQRFSVERPQGWAAGRMDP